VPIIIVTGYGDVPTSVRAMKAGAVEFFLSPSTTKPCSMPFARPSSAAAWHWARKPRCSQSGIATPHSLDASARSWRWWTSECQVS
jgi:ActR/RegA family two-component response regulator